MTEAQIGESLLYLALLFGLTYILAGVLEHFRIPGILSALFVAMAAHYTPLGARLLSPDISGSLSFLSQLGVLFLLFFIGLQIDLKEMRALSRDIVWCTGLNTAMAFLMGVGAMLAMGYGWMLSFVIGITRMPTAEAVIVPILDEFQLIRTRVGEFIVGAGVLDDVIEVFLVALVSVWIAERSGGRASLAGDVTDVLVGLVAFLVVAWISHRWILKPLTRWLPRRPRNLIMLAVVVLFGFGGFAEYASLGMVVGAITAGMLMRPAFQESGAVGDSATRTIQAISYGFLGLAFFFWVGLNVDLGSILKAPELAIVLFLAAFVGKLLGVLIMVPMKKLSLREAWTIGIGLNARLTTEIIVAQLLFDAKIIQVDLFTALVAASSLSTIIVPLVFTVLVRSWSSQLRVPASTTPQEVSRAA